MNALNIGSACRLLLVEDDPDDQLLIGDMIRQLLEGTTSALDIVSTAEEGLNALRQTHYDLALVDNLLGATSGLELVSATQGWPHRPPIVLLTGFGTPELDRHALTQGAADYLIKRELSAELLSRTLRYAMDRHRLLGALEQREHAYRLLFADHPLPMWLFDVESLQIVEVNEAACHQYGYTRDEFLGLRILDLREPEERQSLLDFLKSRPAKRTQHSAGIWRHCRKDGSRLDVEIISCEMSWQGRPTRLIAANDISPRVRAEEALRGSEQTLRRVLNDLSDALLVVDDEHRVQFANPAAEDLFARANDALLGSRMDPAVLLGGSDGDELIDTEGNVHRIALRTSETTWNRSTARIMVLSDVTAQRAAEQQLRLLRRSVEATSDGVLIVDARADDHPVIYANPAFERITAYRVAEIVGRNCRFLQADDRDQPAIETIRQALATEQSCAVVLRNYRKDGSLFWNRLTLAPVRDERDKVSHFIGTIGDISEQKFLEAERNYLATHDTVTGLPRFASNNQRFDEMLAQAHARQRRVAMLYVDIDGFHSVNDTLGYQIGDIALRRVADRLRAHVPPSAEVVRYTGEEFLIVIGDLDSSEDLMRLAEGICECIAEPLILSANATLFLTCSVGASCYPDTAATIVDLVRQADMATIRAKRNGRNGAYVYGNELSELLNDRLALGGHLRNAIARGEFLLHYQPQVDAVDGAVVAMEALVRWNSPEFGFLMPRRFVPVAEDSGVIVQLGLHILETACRQARAWMDQGLGKFLVAVNVSAAQIQRPSFVDDVRRVIEQTGVDPSMLEFEITESVLIDNADRAVVQLQQLKGLGLQLALDDFGMGYSSLGYLRRFPIDKLKIDQSFIQDVTSSGSDAALVRAIVSIGHHLGMRVVAEGVESAAQCGYLRRAHCDEFQGYYFCEPLPADQVPELIRRRYLRPLSESGNSSERVLLLLDDEENILRSLVRLLRRDGYRILTATSAAQAFELLATQPVQVILSDQRMPSMSGTEFLSQVKLMYPDTVRIVLSGYTDVATVTESINRGAIYKFLTKPWDDEDLRAQVQEAFRRYEHNTQAEWR